MPNDTPPQSTLAQAIKLKLEPQDFTVNPFPPCANELLEPVGEGEDDSGKFRREYFVLEGRHDEPESPCLTIHTALLLKGIRRKYALPGGPINVTLRRMFVADLVWLFYMERMRIFQLLGAILDDYATKGRFPIPNLGPTLKALEVMVRQVKNGLSSTVRDRDSAYRRCLGWTSEAGRNLGLDTMVNSAFNTAFHTLIQTALLYYRDRRPISALQGPTATASQATLTDVQEAIRNLRDSFDQFNKFGRNYTITLSGIVWAIAGLGLIRDVRTSIGISEQFKEAREYVTTAYNLLIAGKEATSSQEPNRFTTHLDCAKHARDILLDVEALGSEPPTPPPPPPPPTPPPPTQWDFRTWLDMMEGTFEGYRAAYRSLTGVDLGAPGKPTIEQQV